MVRKDSGNGRQRWPVRACGQDGSGTGAVAGGNETAEPVAYPDRSLPLVWDDDIMSFLGSVSVSVADTRFEERHHPLGLPGVEGDAGGGGAVAPVRGSVLDGEFRCHDEADLDAGRPTLRGDAESGGVTLGKSSAVMKTTGSFQSPRVTYLKAIAKPATLQRFSGSCCRAASQPGARRSAQAGTVSLTVVPCLSSVSRSSGPGRRTW